jgi:hypothetical protein
MKTSSARFDRLHEWYHGTRLQRCAKALQKRGFDATYCEKRAHAVTHILKKIPNGSSVGIGGSVSVRELDLIEKLMKRGNRVTHHWKQGVSKTKNREIRLKEGQSDFYLCSANAITTEGDIINIDGIGNRVAHMIYGPQNVIIVAGYNKIVLTVDDGMKRSREIAGVMNARRVEAKTPCARTGICVDCDSPQRICRVVTIMQYCPWQTDIEVVLVNEHLGF